MRTLFSSLIVLLSCLLFQSCCGECNGIELGYFPVSSSSRNFTEYASSGTLTVQFAHESTTMIANYSNANSIPENYAENCSIDERCGQCCDQYQGEAISTRLTSGLGRPIFDIVIRPDFLNYTPETKPEDSGDVLEITADNQLNGKWFLPGAQPVATLTLDTRTFTNVYVVKDENLTDPSDVVAIYFTALEGIVGFEYGNGEVWSLLP
ncbi:MAG: hypothetical protein AB8F95_11925 [Bacteroidia bacterium]